MNDGRISIAKNSLKAKGENKGEIGKTILAGMTKIRARLE